MARRRQGERVLGPYQEAEDKFRIIEIDEKGERFSSVFPNEKAAEIYKAELLGELAIINQTTSTALDEYREHLKSKGNKPDSIRQTCWAIKMFFPQPVAFDGLTPKKCAALYDALRTRALPGRQPHGFEGPPEPTFLSVDSHRGILSQARTFLAWCIERGYIRGANPLENVKGIGKRRPRGKSLGKSGNELRVKEARAWYAKALELADGDDQGAIAALVALLLGLRANEIVSRKVADLDDDEDAGDLLWIPCSKTPAGRGKSSDRYLFECEREQDAIGKPHVRDWVLDQVHRICDAANVPRVTAHAMRGLLATLTAQRGLAGHMIAATLGHEDQRTTMTAYAAPGAAKQGTNRLGLKVLNGGVQVRRNAAK
jgi:integrase